MTPLRDWGTRSGAAVAAAVFLTLLASLLRVEPIPRVVLALIAALVPLSAARPQAGLLVLAGADAVRRLDRTSLERFGRVA